MEATGKRLTLRPQKLLGTRSGTLTLAAGVAVLAAVVLVVFLGQYRDSVRGGAQPATAFVAAGLIPKGTSGDLVIDEELFKAQVVAEDKLVDGAVLDTADLAGKVAVADVYPGQQITAAAFAAKADPVRGKLSGDQRAISVPLDGAHGLLGQIRTGDRVDVLAGLNLVNGRTGTGRPVIRTLMQNVLVLDVPEDAGQGGGKKPANLTVRVTDRQAAELAFVADNGKVWFALRPPAGASERPASTVSLEALLAGSAPVQAEGE